MQSLVELLRLAFPGGQVEEEMREGRDPAIKISAPADAFEAFQGVMDDLVGQGLLDPTQTFIVFHEI